MWPIFKVADLLIWSKIRWDKHHIVIWLCKWKLDILINVLWFRLLSKVLQDIQVLDQIDLIDLPFCTFPSSLPIPLFWPFHSLTHLIYISFLTFSLRYSQSASLIFVPLSFFIPSLNIPLSLVHLPLSPPPSPLLSPPLPLLYLLLYLLLYHRLLDRI